MSPDFAPKKAFFSALAAGCLAWSGVTQAATVTYRMSSPGLGFDFISVVELSEVGSSQPGGALRFHASSASIFQDGDLIQLQPSDYESTYLDVFGSVHPTFVRFTFDLPSVLGTGFSSASVGVGTSEPGFEDLGDPGTDNIRAFDGESLDSHSGLVSVGAYLWNIEGSAVNPDFTFKVAEVVPEPSAALLGGLGLLGLLRRRRVS